MIRNTVMFNWNVASEKGKNAAARVFFNCWKLAESNEAIKIGTWTGKKAGVTRFLRKIIKREYTVTYGTGVLFERYFLIFI